MPVHKVKGGWKWGKHGHVYKTRAGAERQARAIYASGYRADGQRFENITRAPALALSLGLRALFQQLIDSVQRLVRPYLAYYVGYREDAIHRAFIELDGLELHFINDVVPAKAEPLVAEAMARTAAVNRQLLAELLEMKYDTAFDAGVAAQVQAAREGAAGLIRSLAGRYLQRVKSLLTSTEAAGLSTVDLDRSIRMLGPQAIRHSALIARDQVLKLNAALMRIRQQNAGFESYVWWTVQDEKVRKTHRANHGRVFAWSNPSHVTGHPGHDVNCRCLPVPRRQRESLVQQAFGGPPQVR